MHRQHRRVVGQCNRGDRPFITMIVPEGNVGSLTGLTGVLAGEVESSHVLVHLPKCLTPGGSVAHRFGHLRIIATSRYREWPSASLTLRDAWAAIPTRELFVSPCNSVVSTTVLWLGAVRRSGRGTMSFVDLCAVVAVAVGGLERGASIRGVESALGAYRCHTAPWRAALAAALNGGSRIRHRGFSTPHSGVSTRLTLGLVSVFRAGAGAPRWGFDIPAIFSPCEAIFAPIVIDGCTEGLHQ